MGFSVCSMGTGLFSESSTLELPTNTNHVKSDKTNLLLCFPCRYAKMEAKIPLQLLSQVII